METCITILSRSVKIEAVFVSQEAFRFLGKLVPEVGIPSIDELVLSEVEGGQAPRHGVEAPRDFESIPQLQAISHHFWPERTPQALRCARGQAAQYETKLPYREAPACGRRASILINQALREVKLD
jgi:hypothetical protein